MTGIAAPLLTAAAITITGVVVQQPDALRWPGITLLILVAAASLLVAAVQFGFLARRHVASPEEMRAWWPKLDQNETDARIRDDRADDAILYEWWADLARLTYGSGIVALWAGVGSAVAPQCGADQQTLRWFAAAIAWLTAAGEVAWFVASRRYDKMFTPRVIARRRYNKRRSARN
jgi:hypothetical protein